MEQTHKQNNGKNGRKHTFLKKILKVHFRLHFIIYFNHSFCVCISGAYPGDNFHNKIRRVKYNFFWGAVVVMV